MKAYRNPKDIKVNTSGPYSPQATAEAWFYQNEKTFSIELRGVDGHHYSFVLRPRKARRKRS